MRLAVVGAGYWGVNLVRVFNHLGVLECICDSSVERLKSLAEQYPGVRTECSFEAVLKK